MRPLLLALALFASACSSAPAPLAPAETVLTPAVEEFPARTVVHPVTTTTYPHTQVTTEAFLREQSDFNVWSIWTPVLIDLFMAPSKLRSSNVGVLRLLAVRNSLRSDPPGLGRTTRSSHHRRLGVGVVGSTPGETPVQHGRTGRHPRRAD